MFAVALNEAHNEAFVFAVNAVHAQPRHHAFLAIACPYLEDAAQATKCAQGMKVDVEYSGYETIAIEAGSTIVLEAPGWQRKDHNLTVPVGNAPQSLDSLIPLNRAAPGASTLKPGLLGETLTPSLNEVVLTRLHLTDGRLYSVRDATDATWTFGPPGGVATFSSQKVAESIGWATTLPTDRLVLTVIGPANERATRTLQASNGAIRVEFFNEPTAVDYCATEGKANMMDHFAHYYVLSTEDDVPVPRIDNRPAYCMEAEKKGMGTGCCNKICGKVQFDDYSE